MLTSTESRNTTSVALSALEKLDSEVVKVSPEDIFNMFDSDGDGCISREEYLKMHDALKVLVRSEHQKELQLENDVAYHTSQVRHAVGKVAKANRRLKLLFCFSFAMVCFLLISSALNVASQWYISQAVKDMSVSDSGLMTVKGSDMVTQTATATQVAPLSDLLEMTASELDQVKSITLPTADGETEVYMVTGAKMSAGTLTMHTAIGHDILIHANGTGFIHNGRSLWTNQEIQELNGVIKKTIGDALEAGDKDPEICNQATRAIRAFLRDSKRKIRDKQKECSPRNGLSYSDDGTTANRYANTVQMASVVTAYRVTLEWDLQAEANNGASTLNADFTSERGRGKSRRSLSESAEVSLSGRRSLTSQADLRTYYLNNAESIFPINLYTSMCYDATFLNAQFDWCLNQGYAIDTTNYDAVVDCIDHYHNNLQPGGLPPAPIDPEGGLFPECVSSRGRRLGDRRRMPGGGASCHPARATVELQSGKLARVDEVSVGEYIRTPSGFEPITGFLHADKDAYETYHRLTTDGGSQIEISDNHWLMVDGVEADPAKVAVGQKLATPEGEQAIASIDKVNALGAYHLLTPSGKYFVNGIAASTYVAYVPRPVWKVVGDGYIALRYRLGVPLLADGNSPLRHLWLLDAMDGLRIPRSVQYNLFALPLAISVMLTEIVAAFLVHAPITTSLVGATALPALLLTSTATKQRAM